MHPEPTDSDSSYTSSDDDDSEDEQRPSAQGNNAGGVPGRKISRISLGWSAHTSESMNSGPVVATGKAGPTATGTAHGATGARGGSVAKPGGAPRSKKRHHHGWLYRASPKWLRRLFKPRFHPHSRFSEGFRLLHLFAAYVIVLLLPFQIAFPWTASGGKPVAFSMGWVIDFVFLIHIYVRMHSYVEIDETTELVKSGERIRRIYFRQHGLWDLVSVLPFDLIAVGVGGWVLLPFLRLNRCLRLRYIFLYFAEEEDDLGKNTGMVRVRKFLLFVLGVIHVFACVWFYLACPYNIGGGDPLRPPSCFEGRWSQTPGAEMNLFDLAQPSQYLRSVYWATTTMSAVGYGDIVPQTDGERVFAALCMIVGVLTFSLVLVSLWPRTPPARKLDLA